MKELINKIVKIKPESKLHIFIKPIKWGYTYYRKFNLYTERLVENLRGINFIDGVELDELGLSKKSAEPYQASSGRVKMVLRSLPIKKTDSIIDFGSGKGKMIYMLSKFPFKKVDGVEISDYLCCICNKNIKKLNITKAKIFNSDASTFTEIDSYNYFYFFNPFPAIVMKDVIKNIKVSLTKQPRVITIIYQNPVCHEVIIKSGIFKQVDSYWSVSVYKTI